MPFMPSANKRLCTKRRRRMSEQKDEWIDPYAEFDEWGRIYSYGPVVDMEGDQVEQAIAAYYEYWRKEPDERPIQSRLAF